MRCDENPSPNQYHVFTSPGAKWGSCCAGEYVNEAEKLLSLDGKFLCLSTGITISVRRVPRGPEAGANWFEQVRQGSPRGFDHDDKVLVRSASLCLLNYALDKSNVDGVYRAPSNSRV